MDRLPSEFDLHGRLIEVPSYGENRWQERAALYEVETSDPLAISRFNHVMGNTPSYNNFADVDRLLQTVTHIAAVFDRNYGNVGKIAAGAKHGNVCGVSIADRPEDAIVGMLEGDPRAIFGGSLMFNFDITPERAEIILKYGMPSGRRLIDVIAASGFDEDSKVTLERKAGRMKGLSNPALASLTERSLDEEPRTRYVRGGILVQDNYSFILDLNDAHVDTHGAKAENHQERDMLLAWAIGSTSNSNTVTLVRGGKLIGNGVGQQDRVSAAELAIKRAHDAGHSTEGAVAYSDSFFPFPDGPQRLLDQGIAAILTTSGSLKDEVVFETIKSSGAQLYTIPDEKGRGFYAH